MLPPRGIRNNNPGNIRLSSVRWRGQKEMQGDTAFVEFTDAILGLRALMRLLLTYHLKYGLDSVESIINRYAPPHENATDGYIHAVAGRLGVRRRDKIDLTQKEAMMKLAAAIVRHENGVPPDGVPKDWYAPETYAAAARISLNEQ